MEYIVFGRFSFLINCLGFFPGLPEEIYDEVSQLDIKPFFDAFARVRETFPTFHGICMVLLPDKSASFLEGLFVDKTTDLCLQKTAAEGKVCSERFVRLKLECSPKIWSEASHYPEYQKVPPNCNPSNAKCDRTHGKPRLPFA